jgi:hypothetical protein
MAVTSKTVTRGSSAASGFGLELERRRPMAPSLTRSRRISLTAAFCPRSGASASISSRRLRPWPGPSMKRSTSSRVGPDSALGRAIQPRAARLIRMGGGSGAGFAGSGAGAAAFFGTAFLAAAGAFAAAALFAAGAAALAPAAGFFAAAALGPRPAGFVPCRAARPSSRRSASSTVSSSGALPSAGWR